MATPVAASKTIFVPVKDFTVPIAVSESCTCTTSPTSRKLVAATVFTSKFEAAPNVTAPSAKIPVEKFQPLPAFTAAAIYNLS